MDLAHHIDLDGQWEVAVTDISYPHTWYTVKKEQAFFQCVDLWQHGAPALGENVPTPYNENLNVRTVPFEDGMYEDKDTILQELNAWFKLQGTEIRLAYNEIKRKY